LAPLATAVSHRSVKRPGQSGPTTWTEPGVVFQTWISYQNPKFISVDKQANNDVMHFVEFGETNRLSD